MALTPHWLRQLGVDRGWSVLMINLLGVMRRAWVLMWCAVVLGAAVGAAREKTCDQIIMEIIASVKSGDISKVPLPSVMYSGITSNNPGQKYECEHKTGNVSYNYYLVDWTNHTTNTDVFTGLCVPRQCTREDIQRAVSLLAIKDSNVYDYPPEPKADGLVVASCVIVGLWVAVLALWSIYLSIKEPVANELIKKEEQPAPAEEESLNSLEGGPARPKEDFKLFNFYEGYCRIFKRSSHKNYLSPILFLAALSVTVSTEFSYRQTIAANQVKAMKWFDSLGGVLFANVEVAYSVVVFVLGTKLAFSLFKLSSFHEIGRFFFDQLLVKWAVLLLTSLAAYGLLALTDEPLNQVWRKNYGADCSSVMYQMWFLFRNLQLDCKSCLQWFWVLEVDILLSIVAAPFFIIYRTRRTIGNVLIALVVLTSLVVAVAILDSQSVLFEPYKLFNMAKEFTVNYQTNAIVRMAPYFLGLLAGLTISDGLEKEEGEEQRQSRLVTRVRRSTSLQVAMHVGGALLMLAMLLPIIGFLEIAAPGETRQSAYAYLAIVPTVFLVGLFAFVLPCYWQGESRLTVGLSRVLGWRGWRSLDKMAVGFLLLGPVVIGFTTYSMQNSIYFDFETVLVYLLGDCVIIYVLTLLAVSAVDNQLFFWSKFAQAKLFGNTSKYNVLVVED